MLTLIILLFQEAEKEVMSVSSERDKALQDLNNTLVNHEKELSDR